MALFGLLFYAFPTLLIMLAARFFTARALGMKGVRFFLGGAVADPALATPARRAAVTASALAASYLAPATLFVASNLLTGTPVFTSEIVVFPGKPAEAAGLKTGDRITAVAGKPTSRFQEIAERIKDHAGQPVEITAARGDQEVRFTVVPEGEPGKGKIGIAAGRPRYEPMSVPAAAGAGLTAPLKLIADTAQGLAQFVGGKAVATTGPAAIAAEAQRAGESGPGFTIALLAALLAYGWPITALLALASTPRPKRDPQPKKRAPKDS